ncbi:Acetamidase/Formamidase [Lipomyces oligophaga]|uniref:Acetamidase/Formamidase n=1 Tax=Lipomyces oligophaga TaxID=45792 RepID=UPI0034CD4A28
MGKQAIRTAIKADLNTPAWEQPQLHNRWHPDIPFSAKVAQGEVVKVETLDWTGGQVGNNDSADDIKYCDLSRIHYLSGPIEVEGAKAGDVLVVEIQDVQPRAEQPWGYCAIFDKNNGGGFLDDHYPESAKAIWDFEGIFCSSRHIPGVRFPGLIHPGIMGCKPSKELLDVWNKREAELVAYHHSIGTERTVANLPNPSYAFAGAGDETVIEAVKKEGARTIPPREHGGNCDIKNLSRGSKSYFPVYVDGAGLSIGDLHFSQGDGEISFCGAIEMAGVITIKCEVIKNGMKDMKMKNPMYIPGPVEPHFGPSRYLTFEGLSVDEHGKQHYLDVNIAYKQACLQFIEYFKKFGYSGEQLYILLSCAPVQGHLAAIVDIPNACTTLGVPVDIFDFECLPKEGGFKKIIESNCALTSGN